jgi:hypothetical protein
MKGEKDTGSAFKDESHWARGKYATMDEGKESCQAQFPHLPFIAQLTDHMLPKQSTADVCRPAGISSKISCLASPSNPPRPTSHSTTPPLRTRVIIAKLLVCLSKTLLLTTLGLWYVRPTLARVSVSVRYVYHHSSPGVQFIAVRHVQIRRQPR